MQRDVSYLKEGEIRILPVSQTNKIRNYDLHHAYNTTTTGPCDSPEDDNTNDFGRESCKQISEHIQSHCNAHSRLLPGDQ